MSDRALLFLISAAALIGALGAAIWLVLTGQTGTFERKFSARCMPGRLRGFWAVSALPDPECDGAASAQAHAAGGEENHRHAGAGREGVVICCSIRVVLLNSGME